MPGQIATTGFDEVRADLNDSGPGRSPTWKKTVGEAFDRMAAQVDRMNKKATKALVGISAAATGVSTTIATARDANIRLVENADARPTRPRRGRS